MKILKQGTPPPPPKPEWVGRIVICGNCKTEMQLEINDFVDTTLDNLAYIINCPICNGIIVAGKKSCNTRQ